MFSVLQWALSVLALTQLAAAAAEDRNGSDNPYIFFDRHPEGDQDFMSLVMSTPQNNWSTYTATVETAQSDSSIPSESDEFEDNGDTTGDEMEVCSLCNGNLCKEHLQIPDPECESCCFACNTGNIFMSQKKEEYDPTAATEEKEEDEDLENSEKPQDALQKPEQISWGEGDAAWINNEMVFVEMVFSELGEVGVRYESGDTKFVPLTDLKQTQAQSLTQLEPQKPMEKYPKVGGDEEEPDTNRRRLASAATSRRGTSHATLICMSTMFLLFMTLAQRWAADHF